MEGRQHTFTLNFSEAVSCVSGLTTSASIHNSFCIYCSWRFSLKTKVLRHDTAFSVTARRPNENSVRSRRKNWLSLRLLSIP